MTIVLASNLTIANDVTIDGTVFTVALDGGNSTEVFLINTGATVQLTHLVVQNGYDAAGGGGIYNSGTLALTDSSVLNSFGASGGGIWNVATLTLTNSTLPRNRASYGGAIQNSSGTLTITNSTLSGNTATVVGGGISSVKGTLTLTNSTIAGNTDPVASSINANSTTGTVTNTIIAGGCGRFGLTDNGGNLDDGTSCDLSAATSKSNATLNLVALANNGGPTQTMLPGSGSDAINAVTCADAPRIDQRGYLRPAPADVGLATPCDIGAVEVGSQASNRIFADGFGLPPVYK